MERNRKIGMGMVLMGASLWGSSSNCMEYLMTHQHFTWSAILMARMVLTGLFFLGFCLYKKEPLLAPLREQPWLMLKFTVLGMFIMQVPFVKAIYYSNAATATVLQYLMPAILLIMYLWKAKRGPTRREVVAVGLAILGTALLATKGQGAALAVSPEALFWGILGAFGMAWYTLYAAELLQRYSCFLIIGWAAWAMPCCWNWWLTPMCRGPSSTSTPCGPSVCCSCWAPWWAIRFTWKAPSISRLRRPVRWRLSNLFPPISFPSCFWATTSGWPKASGPCASSPW